MSLRDASWTRSKRPGEKWPRFTAEVPPELAEALDAAQRKSLGINASARNATRKNLVISGLRLYLNRVDPEQEPAIDSTAEEIIDVPALETWNVPASDQITVPFERVQCGECGESIRGEEWVAHARTHNPSAYRDGWPCKCRPSHPCSKHRDAEWIKQGAGS